MNIVFTIILGFGGLELINTIELADSVSNARISYPSQLIWMGDYHSTKVVALYEDGKLIREIDHGAGQGPGQFTNTRNILAFPKEDTLLVFSKHGDTHLFKMSSGEFVKKIIDFMPYNAILRWNQTKFIVIWGMNRHVHDSKNSFVVYGLDGKVVESWSVPQPRWQKRFVYDTVKGYTVGLNNAILMGYVGRPEVRVYPYHKPDPLIWKLHPPRGYEPPPKKNLSRADRFNKKKFRAYYNSFSRIHSIYNLKKKYLMVCWTNKKPLQPTLDVYRLRERNRVANDIPLPGYVVGCENGKILVMEYDDSRDVRTLLHIY